MSSAQTRKLENCVVCDVAAGVRTLATLPQGVVFSCNNCHAHSFSPQPTIEEMIAAYQNFDAGQIAREEFDSYVAQAKSILQADLDVAGVKVGPDVRFLDYGCGGGHFVKAATELGLSAFGIDLDEESQRFGQKRELRIEVGDYRDLKAKFGDKPFDIILMMHVLEHIPHPGDALRVIVNILAPRGLLIIRVPDQDSAPSHFKRILRSIGVKTNEWGFVQPPIHLHGYCTRTFNVLARTHGLEIIQLEKASPLDERHFPTTERYWNGLAIHKGIYGLGNAVGSGGHLAAIFRRGS